MRRVLDGLIAVRGVVMFESPEERVVLLHGLGESPLTMSYLELGLRQTGYVVSNAGYPSTLAAAETLVDQYISPLLHEFAGASRLHFVTHSLGGVLLHAALSKFQPANLGRVVMTAPGLHGSDALEVYRRNWLFRMAYGPAAYESGIHKDGFAKSLNPEADYELGVIAGCISLDPIANLFIPWPHDGKISVGRTRLRGMTDHIVLPTTHDLTATDPTAVWQAVHFLKHGHFFHLLTPASADISAAAA